MPFIEHFELLNLIHYDVVETWATRESGSGRPLLLHRYPKASGLRERLQAMPLEELAKILKAGEDGDYFFVVTYDAPDFRRFLEWVDKPAVAQAVAEAPAVKLEEPRPVEPGEFTGVFQTLKVPPPLAEVPFKPKPANEPGEFTQLFGTPAAPSPPPAAPLMERREPAAEPGEFTRLFKGPAVPPQRPVPSAPPPPSSVQEPGEFTKLFKSSVPAETPPPSAKGADAFRPVEPPPPARPARADAEVKPPKPAAGPGEFTQMFGRPSQSSPVREASANPPPPAQKAPDEPGELTRMFKGPSVPPQRPTPPAGQPSSEFTKLFNNPMPETPLAARLEKPQAEVAQAASFSEPSDFTKRFGRPNQSTPDRNPLPNPVGTAGRSDDSATGIFSKKNIFDSGGPQAPMAAGPSEYTRLFQSRGGSSEGAGASPVQAEQKPAAPAPPAATKPAQSLPLALTVILVAIVVVAIALVLYFVMKR
jgi:hypothetical protein